ncbi:MAG TPA: LolA-related protein [Steroidobacteraceae bacterium]|nr:LolA-related protein [Steroidobacteraceae bacterium]
MTFGKRPLFILLATLAPLTQTHSASLDADALIASLAKPAPAHVEFTEVRFSPLLDKPLVVSGELGHEGEGELDRKVREPYVENTYIRGESVRVERQGEPVRSFALKRAPELRSLLTGFSALLTGDASSVEQSFDLSSQGNQSHWTLTLVPKDARTRKRLSEVRVDGRERDPRCFSILNADGGASIMLLGDAARVEMPIDLTRDWVENRCRG